MRWWLVALAIFLAAPTPAYAGSWFASVDIAGNQISAGIRPTPTVTPIPTTTPLPFTSPTPATTSQPTVTPNINACGCNPNTSCLSPGQWCENFFEYQNGKPVNLVYRCEAPDGDPKTAAIWNYKYPQVGGTCAVPPSPTPTPTLPPTSAGNVCGCIPNTGCSEAGKWCENFFEYQNGQPVNLVYRCESPNGDPKTAAIWNYKYPQVGGTCAVPSDQTPIPVLTLAPIISPALDFYVSPDRRTAGFTINNVGQFTDLSFIFSYDTAVSLQGATGMASLAKQSQFTRTGIVLGTCSSGGVCNYFPNVHNLGLSVFLKSQDSAPVVLQKIIP